MTKSTLWDLNGSSALDQAVQSLATTIQNQTTRKTVFGYIAHNVLEELRKVVGDPVDPALFRNKAAEEFKLLMTRGFSELRAGTLDVKKFITGTVAALETAAQSTTFAAIQPTIDTLFDSEKQWGDPIAAFLLARARKEQTRSPNDTSSNPTQRAERSRDTRTFGSAKPRTSGKPNKFNKPS